MTRWALLPLKAAAQRKTRLASMLTLEERIALSKEMLLHVAQTVRNSHCVDRIAVLCSEPLALPAWLHQIRDRHNELNAAVSAAVRETRREPSAGCAIILPDLPLLRSDDVRSLFAIGQQRKIAIAPDKTGLGTNAVWIDAGIDFEFQFGLDSFSLHIQHARTLTSDAGTVQSIGLAFDLDTASDLEWYRDGDRARASTMVRA